MSSADDFDSLIPRLRTMQIVAAALIMGCFIFLAIVLGLRLTGNAQPPPTPLLTYVGIAFAALILMPYVIVSTAMVAAGRKRLAQQLDTVGGTGNTAELVLSLCNLYQTRLIVREALLEGVTFFQLIAYLLEGQPVSLLVAAALLAGMIGQFPTRSKVESWIDGQQELIHQEQGAGG